ncbi:MAG: UDP-N-acetylmuramoyl-L-alanyl-D-glutamate--2,6-diaminopimelate ligase, partial [Candidatus Nanopelagicus sp.]
MEFDSKIFNQQIVINGVSINAQKVVPGDLFIAFAGAKTHGISYLEQAISNGAVAVLSDKKIAASIPSFTHPKPRELVGAISAWLYGHPFERMSAIGITGTNGKTTTANLVKQIWELNSIKSGLIGTLGIEIGNEKLESARTTPEADDLQAIAAAMVEHGCKNLAMEVSSHAIDQGRIKGAKYEVVAFSNLTQDHLDYHLNMENYFQAKANLFTTEYAKVAVINIDDSYGKKLIQQVQIPFVTVSRKDSTADWYLAKAEIRNGYYRIEIKSKTGESFSENFALLGDYNLDNLLLAVAIVNSTGLTLDKIAPTISKLQSVPGRLEIVNAGQEFTALVDYAHTPDAVERVIATVKSVTNGKIIGVLGCGGDRDASKRSVMGHALFNGCDLAIFTSDNPRSESAEAILKQMTAGIDLGKKGLVEIDRKNAIDLAINNAQSGDVVLLMGKGH